MLADQLQEGEDLLVQKKNIKMTLFLAVILAAVSLSYGLSDAEIELFQTYGKVTVDGSDATYYTLTSDGLPDHDVRKGGTEQSYQYKILKTPVRHADADTGCLPMGPVGMALNGVAFYSPFSIEIAPALTCERTDQCIGHPDSQGRYHYHGNPECLKQGQPTSDDTPVLLGVAFDGYPIYRKTINGVVPTTAELNLDSCHGTDTSDGYRYYVSSDYPWVIGCFRGETEPAYNRKANRMKSDGKCHRVEDVVFGSDVCMGNQARKRSEIPQGDTKSKLLTLLLRELIKDKYV